ncbi:glycosyltransferase domain-containing protein [Synechococcus sp. MU1617]|uniref:glycosyltransferase domain-containing protein n=1 Tax=Synechococcus sp. MU1617 TaxID=2508346 RepID=UPI00351D3BF1
MNAKIPKILSHIYFPDAQWTIWCDSNIKLLITPEELIRFFDFPNIGVYSHFKRDSINDEISAFEISKKRFF